MFEIKQKPDGKWVLTWGGAEFPQTPLDTREQAENRLARMTARYPKGSFDLVLAAGGQRRGGPYTYSFPEEYHEYLAGTPIKPCGITGSRTRDEAKDNFRYRMELHGIPKDKIRALLVVLTLEPV